MRTIALLSLLAAALNGDTLTLKNGRVMNGTYLGGTAREVRMDMGDHVETVPVDRIAMLQFDNSTPPAAADAAPQPQADVAPPPPPTPNNYSPAPVSAPAPPAANAGIVIPQGTGITVRMIDPVDSQKAQLGDQFRASIEDPVVINGQTVIPRGADVNVRLVDDQQSGKITGKTVLTLAITNISINGRLVDVTTGDVQQASGSRGARSAGVIGGATVLGAIIGAAAGGGRGAAIGAGSGAAVGTGAEVMTKGQRVKIPSEARLTFTLSNDVTV
jgi:hypothetical protein